MKSEVHEALSKLKDEMASLELGSWRVPRQDEITIVVKALEETDADLEKYQELLRQRNDSLDEAVEYAKKLESENRRMHKEIKAFMKSIIAIGDNFNKAMCHACDGLGEVHWNDGDRDYGGPCPYCSETR